MNRLLLLILFCTSIPLFLSQNSFSQNSLKDTLVINELLEVADSLLANNPKATKKLVDSAMVIAKNLDIKEYEYKCLQSRFAVLYYMGKYKKALKNLDKLLIYYKSINDTLKIATVYNDIGLVYTEMTDYPKALEYLQNAIKLRGNKGSLEDKVTTLGNIGMAYIYSNKFEDALKYSNMALKIFEEINFNEGTATMKSNIGYTYYNLKEYDKALTHYNLALQIYRTENHLEGIARVYNLIGMLNFHWEKYSKSIEYIQKSADIRLEMGHNNGYLYALNNVAYVYNFLGQRKNAISIFKKALEATDDENDKRVKTLLLTNLSDTYSKSGDYKNANKYLQNYIKLNDEIFNTEKSEQIEELKIEFETEQKEAEIKNLKDITELQNESLERRQMIIFLLIGTLILIALILYFGITRYRLKTEQQALKLEQQALKLEQPLLRSQMNPHFIFNSLSVIQGYIFKGSTKEAAGYLSSFAKLMRHILENSREEFVPLDKEIETLEHYLQLQNIRNEGKIDYSIIVSNGIDKENISVPPMIAQPFIENSIKHGFKEDDKISIIINYILKNRNLFLSIEDDGIGINKSKENSKKSDQSHNSLAISITESRLQLLNKTKKEKFNLKITDISEENSNKTGTRIEIEIPYLEEF
jgi:tetratricopeptide (TPR) repeat protein